MRLLVAFRAFFAALFSGDASRRIDRALLEGPASAPAKESVPSNEPDRSKPVPIPATTGKLQPVQRSDALTLLSVLQREARFLDLVHESLEAYSDAQIGSAARDVLRDTKKVLDRMFAISSASDQGEGSRVSVPVDASALRYRVVGSQSAGAASEGTLVHAGWIATQCQVPQWTGKSDESMILAPIEVEVTR